MYTEPMIEKIEDIFPYFKVEFNKEGGMVKPDQVDKILTYLLKSKNVTDLLVISHGWSNDMKDADELYKDFFKYVKLVMQDEKKINLTNRNFTILGILWPSHKFAKKELIPGGAAGSGSLIKENLIKSELDNLKIFLDSPESNEVIDQVKDLVAELELNNYKVEEFANLIHSLLPKEEKRPNKSEDDEDDILAELVNSNWGKLLLLLANPILLDDLDNDDGAAGSKGSHLVDNKNNLNNLFGGPLDAVCDGLNLFTYYTMKTRSKLIGEIGLAPLLNNIRRDNPYLNLHLIGHSFGGRLVTAAVHQSGYTFNASTMTLLQAAFSHHGFAENFDGKGRNGFFRDVVTSKNIIGPILISHSRNDRAVRFAYILASLVGQQDAASRIVSKIKDQYGGIGRNGARKTPEAIDINVPNIKENYNFQIKMENGDEIYKLYNLNADEFIKNHSDICGREVAYAVLSLWQRHLQK